MEQLEKVYELSLLYDFYGNLLSERKKQIFNDYILNDLSLAEVAENEGISRQGVHDAVKNCEKSLEMYEEALHLAQKYKTASKICDEIEEIAKNIGGPQGDRIAELIKEIRKNGI
ncbi:MAG: YlxM family DNA-binding protein [Lachnospiraceae bacterium]|nr:YlxM family DNA-binding protein [Lachnospiraceae bacterium]